MVVEGALEGELDDNLGYAMNTRQAVTRPFSVVRAGRRPAGRLSEAPAVCSVACISVLSALSTISADLASTCAFPTPLKRGLGPLGLNP
jgi:hypothetical protein